MVVSTCWSKYHGPEDIRHIDLMRRILEEILPDEKYIRRPINEANTLDALNELIRETTIVVDGFSTAIQRPQKNDVRKEAYSGKRKKFVVTTIVYTNLDEFIVGMSSTMPGSAHDLKIIRRQMGLDKWEEQ